MNLKQILAAALVLMLTFSPAMAAYCDASCSLGQLISDTVNTASTDMTDCHQGHDPQPTENTDFHDNCGMAGCHTVASATIFQTNPYQSAYDPDRLHSHFIPTAASADLPPPIKPPA